MKELTERNDVEPSVRKWVTVKNLTLEELRESKLPDSCLGSIWSSFTSTAGKHYEAVHVCKHPYGPYILLCGLDRDEADFRQVVSVIARETRCKPEVDSEVIGRTVYFLFGKWKTEDISIYDRGDDIINVIRLGVKPTQQIVANFIEAYAHHFQEVQTPIAYWYNVPTHIYDNSGLPLEKLSFTQTP